MSRRLVDANELVCAEQIADRVGVVSSAVANWQRDARRDHGSTFPSPVFAHGRTKVWSWPDVAKWLASNPRVGKPRRMT